MVMRARLLIAATVVGASAWLVGGGWRFDRGGTWRTFLLGVALPIVVMVGLIGLALLTGRRSTLPAAFDVRAGAFVAPPGPLAVAAWTSASLALLLFAVGSQLRTLTDDDEYPVLVGLAVLLIVLLTGAFLLAVPRVLATFRDRPRLELRPEGLASLDAASTHVVPWEAIAVGPDPRGSHWGVARIVLARPELVRVRGLATLRRRARTVALPQLLAIHPTFLADAVNHYLLHPDHRAAIGTPAEHERLRAALAAAYEP